jgi:membrane associated rhomboid family serine protease
MVRTRDHTGVQGADVANQLSAGASGGSARGRAELILAEAQKAFFVMAGVLVVIWAVQIANWADRYGLSRSYGVQPHSVTRLPDIFVSPFLHWSWSHIEANSGPLFVLGFLAAYRGVWRFAGVTAIVAATSGLAVWLFQSQNAITVGASGLVFGYFGYVVARGIFDRNLIDTVLGVVIALSYAYMLTVAIPGTPGVSWVDHVGGLAGGVAAGWLFRARRPKGQGKPGRKPGAPAGTGGGTGTPAVTGRFRADGGNPRADLHRELGELGL